MDRLSYVKFGYNDYGGTVLQGALISSDVVAPEILDIFKNFYDNNIAIEKTGGIAKKGGTGMFNCRKITTKAGFSLHSYGTALDLSCYHNPYVEGYTIPEVIVKVFSQQV